MLTKKQNFLETIRGGNPDRIVNQFEALNIFMPNPHTFSAPMVKPGGEQVKDAWGVTWAWPAGTPGQFPVHTPDKIVIKDIENWRDYVKFPRLDYTAEDWAPFIGMASHVDRNEQFLAPMIFPGIFEMCHNLMEIQTCLMNFYEYPDEMHELIDALTEWELKYAEQICTYLKPDAIFHHDDWGSHTSTFMSPDMWREFIKPAYAKIYGYYKAHGVEVIVHHNDAFSATLVPDMIDVGIDVWQGVVSTNNVAELVEKYGDKISFMGPVDSAKVDFPGWTKEVVREQVWKACETFGTKSVIHGASIGGPMSSLPGVYQAITDAIDEYNAEKFGHSIEEMAAGRPGPMSLG